MKSSPAIFAVRSRIAFQSFITRGDVTMRCFHSSKSEAWARLCEETGSELIDGGFWKAKKVRAQVGPWTILLDSHRVSDGENSRIYTRLRAPFVNPGGFRFAIYRKGPFSGLGKFFGMQDIEVGDPEFDEAFIIQGNDDDTVRELFANSRIRDLIMAQPRIRLEVKDNEGWFGVRFPDYADLLIFQAPGVITDVARLTDLFKLFPTMLDQLCRMGVTTKEHPGVSL